MVSLSIVPAVKEAEMPTSHSTNEYTDYNDRPISHPSEDTFGTDPLARTIVRCLTGMQNPEGSALAICGPWGSGKSSTMNLVTSYIKQEATDIHVVHFHCWHYRTERAVAQGFFRELDAGLEPALSKSVKAQRAIRQLSVRVAGAGGLVGAVFGAAAHPTVGEFVQFLWGKIFGNDEAGMGDEALQTDLIEGLEEFDGRFLIVIDDMDRLLADEVVTLFRLVKSIGRLPKVMYLMAYDRAVVEEIIGKHCQGKGREYLGKIVQASFELPATSKEQLEKMLWDHMLRIFRSAQSLNKPELYEILNKRIMPDIATPRDAIKLINKLEVAWGAVEDDVHPSDLALICSVYQRWPDLYRKLQDRKVELVGSAIDPLTRVRELTGDQYDSMLLEGIDEGDHDHVRQILMRLFPQLESAWGGRLHDESERMKWDKQRRICTPHHFDSYFVYAVSQSAVSMKELRRIGEKAADSEFIESTLLEALEQVQAGRRSKASYIFDGLTQHCELIRKQDIEPFLSTIFGIGDKFVSDSAPELLKEVLELSSSRVMWMTKALLLEQMTLDERSKCLLSAMQGAPLAWLVTFEPAVRADAEVSGHAKPTPTEQLLMYEQDVAELGNLGIEKIRALAREGSLVDEEGLIELLLWWVGRTPSDKGEISAWCYSQLDRKDTMIKLVGKLLDFVHQRDLHRVNDIFDLEKLDLRIRDWLEGSELDDEERQLLEQWLEKQ